MDRDTTRSETGTAAAPSSAGGRPVTVVTDSTADIPAELRASLGIAVVPLTVRFGEETFRDRIDLDSAAFLARLRASPTLPQTSQPPTPAFEAVFRDAVADGNDVVCVTITAGLSGTGNAARLAAEAVDAERIRVVDSKSVSMACGWVAIEAARAAQAGAGLADVAEAAMATIPRYRLYAVLETLDYLHKGGRIGRASQLVGSMLSIKPILGIGNGDVHPVERVRTWRKALDRMTELARAQAPLAGLAVLHVGNPGDAKALAHRLADLTPDGNVVTGDIGPVVATYAGPGCVGVVTLTPP